MRPALLKLLRCPECGGPLWVTDAWTRHDDAIVEGGLRCGCNARFPIIARVPRMLSGYLRRLVEGRHPGFFAQHPAYRLQGASPSSWSARTGESFGFLWRQHQESVALVRRYWEQMNQRFPPDFFEGKLLLEAGCGNGRYAVHFAAAGAEVVAMDLSEAADVAQKKLGPRAHVVQGDLCAPPFAPSSFDFVNCFGVLHHLPAPLTGFAALRALVLPGGTIQVYAYKSFRDENLAKWAVLRGLAGVRRVTTRLPRRALAAAMWAGVPPYLALVGAPHAALRSLGAARLADRWPLFQQEAVLDPRHAHELLLDRFATPIEHRYTRAEFAAWFQDSGLEDVEIHQAGGWVGSGRRPG